MYMIIINIYWFKIYWY